MLDRSVSSIGEPAFSVAISRSIVVRFARRFESAQSMYEWRKNRIRGAVLSAFIEPGGLGAELGVFKGHLTGTLVRRLAPSHLYVVDPWYLLGPRWEWAAGNKSTVNGLRRVLGVMRTEIESGRGSVVVADDREFLAGLPDATFDWVYVDSSHAYEHTRDELTLLVNKVKPGGIVAGDDWRSHEEHRHHGVCRAVREFVKSGSLVLLYADDYDRQWVTRVPTSDCSYRTRLFPAGSVDGSSVLCRDKRAEAAEP